MKEIEAKKYFGNSLMEIRNARGLSARDLAKLVGFSNVYISDLEKGNRKPTLKMINIFCNTLLLTDEEKQKLNDGFAYAHPELVIPSDIMYYILENNLVDTIRIIQQEDENGTKLKTLAKTINKTKENE